MKKHHDEKGKMAPAQSKIAQRMRGDPKPKHSDHTKASFSGWSDKAREKAIENRKRLTGGGVKEKKMHRVMDEFKHGKLHSGSKKGPEVKSRKQAIAIGLSEGRRAAAGHKKK